MGWSSALRIWAKGRLQQALPGTKSSNVSGLFWSVMPCVSCTQELFLPGFTSRTVYKLKYWALNFFKKTMCLCTCEWVCMWKPEVDVGYLPPLYMMRQGLSQRIWLGSELQGVPCVLCADTGAASPNFSVDAEVPNPSPQACKTSSLLTGLIFLEFLNFFFFARCGESCLWFQQHPPPPPHTHSHLYYSWAKSSTLGPAGKGTCHRSCTA